MIYEWSFLNIDKNWSNNCFLPGKFPLNLLGSLKSNFWKKFQIWAWSRHDPRAWEHAHSHIYPRRRWSTERFGWRSYSMTWEIWKVTNKRQRGCVVQGGIVSFFLTLIFPMSTSRLPFNGRSRKLVLAFDVGTTYSGISYRYANLQTEDDDRCSLIDIW